MSRHIFEIGADAMPVIERHGLDIDREQSPAELIAQVLQELANRAKTYRADLKLVAQLKDEIDELTGVVVDHVADSEEVA